ncbi:hypothetical protein D3C71_884660 [compost metagenome]
MEGKCTQGILLFTKNANHNIRFNRRPLFEILYFNSGEGKISEFFSQCFNELLLRFWAGLIAHLYKYLRKIWLYILLVHVVIDLRITFPYIGGVVYNLLMIFQFFFNKFGHAVTFRNISLQRKLYINHEHRFFGRWEEFETGKWK